MLVGVAGLDGNVDMQPIAASGLGKSFELQQIKFSVDQLRGFNNAIVAALAGVKINQDKIRILQRTNAAHPGILVNTSQVGEIQQAGVVIGDYKIYGSVIVLGENRFFSQPGREALRSLFLEEKLAFNSIGIALER